MLGKPLTFAYRSSDILVDASAEILLAPVCPTLVKKYQGIQVHQSGGITIALYSPSEQTYKQWDGTEWLNVLEPEFQSIDTINAGIEHWVGFIQIRLKLEDSAQWQELEIGYEVAIELVDWFMRFGLPNFFSESIQFNYMSTCSDGVHIEPPPLVNLAQMEQISVQPIHHGAENSLYAGKCFTAVADASCDTLFLETEIPIGLVNVIYNLTPKIEYILGEHQISETPCVTLRFLREENKRNPVWSFPINENLNRVTYISNLIFELVVIANEIKDAKTIANTYYSKIRHRGKLYADPLDRAYAVGTIGLPRENPLQDVEGSLPSITILGIIYNVPVMESNFSSSI